MIRGVSILSILGICSAVVFQSFIDKACTLTASKAIAFTDVCTWTSNLEFGSYALTLTSCNETAFEVSTYNLTGQAGCNGIPNNKIQITNTCNEMDGIYVKGLDFTCESKNTSYNLLAHFTPDCEDGGYAFSIQLGEPTCQESSFAPQYFNWDTEGGYVDSYYKMMIYNSTNGACEDQIALFETKQFPVECLAPVENFNNISVDIYPSFPLGA